MKRSIATVVTAFLVALAVGVIAVAINDWFGGRDLFPFAIYCIPFALLTAPATAIVFKLTTRLPVWLASALAMIAGLLFGWLCTCAVALFLGPWFGAMSVPVLQVWCIAAAFVFSAEVLLRRASSPRGVAGGLVVLALLCVFAPLVLIQAFLVASGDQRLTVLIFRHHPGDGELDISDAFEPLDPADLAILKQSGLRGTLEGRGSSATGSTKLPRAKALIIFTPPLTTGASLPQPKHCTIAYVQEGSSFRQVPAGAPTFSRQIHIQQESGDWRFEVEHSSGARSGGSVSP
jgi:hypothetical protein